MVFFLAVILFAGLARAEFELSWPNAKITVRVVGEDGVAISNANVHIGFPQGGNAWVGQGKHQVFHGSSDTNGCYTAEARSEMSPGGSVEKEGYYRSFWDYIFKGNYQVIKKWQPWNPTVTVVLRKIVNPIPMYAKRVETQIPKTNEVFGYDLIIGDWVMPLGKGSVSDLMFCIDGFWNNSRDNMAALQLTFSNKDDGIQRVHSNQVTRSVFRLPREAPAMGYKRSITWRKMRKDNADHKGDILVNDYSEGMNYFFCVRTRTNEAGIVTNAYYGKIHGDFEFGGASAKGGYLKFTYYLNPTSNDRNMEFDPKQNLFKNLKSSEEVQEP